MKSIRISCAVITLALTACGHDDTQAYIPQQVQPSTPMQQPVQNVMPAPVVVQQPSNDGFLTGMLMGHMLSGGGSSRSSTIVEHHYAPATQYRAPSYSSSSYRSGSSFRSSSVGRSFGGRR